MRLPPQLTFSFSRKDLQKISLYKQLDKNSKKRFESRIQELHLKELDRIFQTSPDSYKDFKVGVQRTSRGEELFALGPLVKDANSYKSLMSIEYGSLNNTDLPKKFVMKTAKALRESSALITQRVIKEFEKEVKKKK